MFCHCFATELGEGATVNGKLKAAFLTFDIYLYIWSTLKTFAVGDWDEDGIEESVFFDDYYSRRPGPPGPRDRSLLDAIRNTALGKEIT